MCSIIVSLLYFHPMITRTSFSAFQCVTLLPGEQWLRVEMDIRCWTGRHSFFALAAALPAAVLWGVGIPILALLLVKYRKRLRAGQIGAVVGYMCANYKSKFYYWEVVNIYRKLSVILLLTFLSTLAAVTQGLTFVLLLSALALVQFNNVPFKRVALNRSELLSEVAVLLTVYAGICFQLAFLSGETEAALFALVLAVNGAFLIYFAKILLGTYIRRAFNKWISGGTALAGHHALKKATQLRDMALLQEQAKLLGFLNKPPLTYT